MVVKAAYSPDSLEAFAKPVIESHEFSIMQRPAREVFRPPFSARGFRVIIKPLVNP
jgi:hypothetical protein